MKTEYLCPLCKSNLESVEGTQINSKDGWTLYCANKETCQAQEVSGHGDNVEKAYKVIQFKFAHVKEEPIVRQVKVENMPTANPKPKITSIMPVLGEQPKRGRGRPRKIETNFPPGIPKSVVVPSKIDSLNPVQKTLSFAEKCKLQAAAMMKQKIN